MSNNNPSTNAENITTSSSVSDASENDSDPDDKDEERKEDEDDSDNDDDDDDDEDDDDDFSDETDDDEDEDESNMIQSKSLLFLCQEGQIRLARQRLQLLKNSNNLASLKREIFQVGRDKNYPLHEVIMGGTLENSSKNIIPEFLSTGKQWKGPFLIMMNAQPPSHGRTVLHWAAWGNASLEILQSVVMANPEALILKDKASHGSRTPLQIFQRYHCPKPGNVWHEGAQQKRHFLETSTKAWTQHRLRLAMYKAALHHFCGESHKVPFSKQQRKEIGIKPKPWFCISVLGYCLQREMEPLVWKVLNFVGEKAQVVAKAAPKKSRKRRRS